MERSFGSCFADLRDLAARLDVDIDNARNRLENPRFNSAAQASKFLEEVTQLEKDMLSVKQRVTEAVRRQKAHSGALKAEIRKVEEELRDSILKLLPRGFQLPDHLLSVVEHLFVPEEINILKNSRCAAPVSCHKEEPEVQRLDFQQAFNEDKSPDVNHGLKGPVHPSCLSSASSRPVPSGTQLEKYLQEIELDDTMVHLMPKNKPPPPTRTSPVVPSLQTLPSTGKPVQNTFTKHDYLPPLLEEHTNVTREATFAAKKTAPKTPELKENPTAMQTVPTWKKQTPKTPDFADFLPPLLMNTNLTS